MAGPTPGTMMDGYQFKGGNPADRTNWAPAQGEQWLQYLSAKDPHYANLVRGIVEGRGAYPTLARNNPQNRRLMGDIVAVDPSFNQTVYKQRADLYHEFNLGDTAKQLKNLTNVAFHANDLKEAYDQMNLSSWQGTNWLQNFLAERAPMTDEMRARQRQLGRTNDAINFLAPEAARLGMGGAPNESDVTRVTDTLNQNTAPDVSTGVLADMAHKVAQRLIGIQDQWKRGFGNIKPSQPLVDPQAAIAIHKLLNNYKVEGSDQLDWNTLTAGGWNPAAMNNGVPAPARQQPIAPPQAPPMKQIGRFQVPAGQ